MCYKTTNATQEHLLVTQVGNTRVRYSRLTFETLILVVMKRHRQRVKKWATNKGPTSYPDNWQILDASYLTLTNGFETFGRLICVLGRQQLVKQVI